MNMNAKKYHDPALPVLAHLLWCSYFFEVFHEREHEWLDMVEKHHLGDEIVKWSSHLGIQISVVLLLQVISAHVHRDLSLVLGDNTDSVDILMASSCNIGATGIMSGRHRHKVNSFN